MRNYRTKFTSIIMIQLEDDVHPYNFLRNVHQHLEEVLLPVTKDGEAHHVKTYYSDSQELKDLPEYGDKMPIGKFIDSVHDGLFINSDGHGCYATYNMISEKEVIPSDVKNQRIDFSWTHIVWFNK